MEDKDPNPGLKKHGVEDQIKKLDSDSNSRAPNKYLTKRDLMDHLECAWGVIANAYGGDWDKAFSDWKTAAEKWRDKYFEM